MSQLPRSLVVLALVPLLAACPGADSTGPSSCTGPLPYVAGTSVTGTTNTGSNLCKGPDGATSSLYSFTVQNGGGMRITVAANGFPPHIALFTSSNTRLAESNAGSMPAYLPAGTYVLAIGSASNADGTFTLTSPAYTNDGCSTDVIAAKGVSFSGTLSSSTCGATVKNHMFHLVGLAAGSSVSISYTVDRQMGFNLVGGCTVNKEMATGGSGVMTCTASGSDVTLNIESRTVGANTNLPMNYSISIN